MRNTKGLLPCERMCAERGEVGFGNGFLRAESEWDLGVNRVESELIPLWLLGADGCAHRLAVDGELVA